MITPEEKHVLEGIVGAEWVSTAPCMMDTYSLYMNPEILNREGGRFLPRPEAVVLPENTEQVQEIVKYCNTNDLMVKPISTGFGTWAAVSRERVILLDLKRMNRIVDIDVKNQVAIIEPGMCQRHHGRVVTAAEQGIPVAIARQGVLKKPAIRLILHKLPSINSLQHIQMIGRPH